MKTVSQILRSPWLLLGAWAALISVVLTLTMSFHFASHKIHALSNIPLAPKLTAHHFLSLKCTCSKNLIEHLLERGAKPGVREIIHMLHSNTDVAASLEKAGFEIEAIDEETAFKKYQLDSLPQLLVVNAATIVYQGGYARDQQHTRDYQDLEIFADAARGIASSQFPILGCANGRLAKAALDKWGLKYEASN